MRILIHEDNLQNNQIGETLVAANFEVAKWNANDFSFFDVFYDFKPDILFINIHNIDRAVIKALSTTSIHCVSQVGEFMNCRNSLRSFVLANNKRILFITNYKDWPQKYGVTNIDGGVIAHTLPKYPPSPQTKYECDGLYIGNCPHIFRPELLKIFDEFDNFKIYGDEWNDVREVGNLTAEEIPLALCSAKTLVPPPFPSDLPYYGRYFGLKVYGEEVLNRCSPLDILLRYSYNTKLYGIFHRLGLKKEANQVMGALS